MKKALFILFLALGIAAGKAQPSASQHIPQQIIAWFHSKTSESLYFNTKQMNHSFQLSVLRRLSDRPNIVLLQCQGDEDAALRHLRSHPAVHLAQFDHYVERRTFPDDPKYSSSQWNLDSLGLPQAWEYTTGGISPNGDSIVVAVIDGGCDLGHEDLSENIWYNRGEIPNNAVDDDQNGWVDDFAGWRVDTDNDQHAADSHGTSVSGIIGAVGNNGKGISGVNWRVKLMIVSGDEQQMVQESYMVEAYAYVLAARRLYNESGGQRGAYVVATNASLGINYGQPEDYPIWCAMYDSLGQQGILSAGATANMNVNVDQVGDMPTTCPSDYLIAVTQTDQYNLLYPIAAYGATSIDIAAYGTIYSTRPGDVYNVFGGTSGASPNVAAAVALLYAYPHADWATMQRDNPQQAAQLVKQILIEQVNRVEDLEGRTVSGGILHVGQAMERLAQYFHRPDQSDLVNLFPVPASHTLQIECALADEGDYTLEIADMMGRRCWSITFKADQAQMRRYSVAIQDWAKGVYAVRLRYGKTCWTKKWVKG